MRNRDRRDFLKHSSLLAGAAGALASVAAAPAAAQTGAPTARRADRYHDSFITGQPLRIKYLERAS